MCFGKLGFAAIHGFVSTVDLKCNGMLLAEFATL